MRKSTSTALVNAGNHLRKDAVSFINGQSGKAACGGVLAGSIVGKSIGIATLGTAINSAWVLASVVGGACWLAVNIAGRNRSGLRRAYCPKIAIALLSWVHASRVSLWTGSVRFQAVFMFLLPDLA